VSFVEGIVMRICKLLCCLLGLCAWPGVSAWAQPTLAGWIEQVKLGSDGLVMPAKLDTGADTSSLHVSNIAWIRRADGDWVSRRK
jgi:hypothetical protein